MEDPTRLCDQDGVPRSLTEALELLRQPAPSAEVVTQIENQLRALPARPLASSLGRAKLLTLGSCVALLGVAGVFVTTRWAPGHAPASEPAARITAPQSAPPALQPSAAAECAAPGLDAMPVAVAPQAAVAVPRAAERGPSPRLRGRQSRAAAASAPARPVPVSQPVAAPFSASTPLAGAVDPAPVEARAAAPAPALDLAEPADVRAAAPAAAPDLAGPAPAASVSAQQAPEVVAAPQDEAGLLFRAKAAERRDPEGALKLLATHVRFFPNGRYAEEREALTIRLYQRLGRAAEASALTKQFRERFPGSLYRVTLPE